MFEIRPYRTSSRSALNPFREIEELERQFFDAPFRSFMTNGGFAEFKTDITDEGDSYLLETDLPGFDKNDIHLDLSGDTLTIEAERHSQHEQKEKRDKYVHVERSYGKYSRSFDVSGIDTDGIRAKYDNGVLKLTLPKKQAAVPESKHLAIE